MGGGGRGARGACAATQRVTIYGKGARAPTQREGAGACLRWTAAAAAGQPPAAATHRLLRSGAVASALSGVRRPRFARPTPMPAPAAAVPRSVVPRA
jgi:hypothetical protein